MGGWNFPPEALALKSPQAMQREIEALLGAESDDALASCRLLHTGWLGPVS